jgi:3-hydroxyacyl-CoA dehydrogenase
MNKALIVGAGQMGVTIAYGMHKLGFKTYFVEPNEETLENSLDKLEGLNAKPQSVFHSLGEADAWIEDGFDVIISAAPFKCNEKLLNFL